MSSTATTNGSFYKNVNLHAKLGCGDDCPLLRPGYNVALWNTAEAAARRASRRFDSSFNLQMALGMGLIDPPHRVELVDGELHGDGYIWVAKKPAMPHYHDGEQQLELVETVYHEMFSIFNDNQQNRFQTSFEPNFELLLWSAVGSRDAEVLQAALSLNRHIKTPPCIAMSMLCSAIDSIFENAVPILLNRSKSGDPARPLLALFRRFSVSFFELADDQPDAYETAAKLMAIYKQLLYHYGAENCYRTFHVDLLKSYQVISYLAMLDCDEAISVIEALPPSLFDAEMSDPGEESLLMATFFDCALLQSVKILANAVLPLLRCGAVGHPDLLNFNPSHVAGVRFEATNCMQFIHRHEVAARLAVEMRPNNCCLDVRALELLFERMLRQHQQQQRLPMLPEIQEPVLPHNFFNYTSFFVDNFYPRSLVATCRVAILRRLPRGLKRRSDALKRLKLPVCMSDLLRFKDLDDLLFLIE